MSVYNSSTTGSVVPTPSAQTDDTVTRNEPRPLMHLYGDYVESQPFVGVAINSAYLNSDFGYDSKLSPSASDMAELIASLEWYLPADLPKGRDATEQDRDAFHQSLMKAATELTEWEEALSDYQVLVYKNKDPWDTHKGNAMRITQSYARTRRAQLHMLPSMTIDSHQQSPRHWRIDGELQWCFAQSFADPNSTMARKMREYLEDVPYDNRTITKPISAQYITSIWYPGNWGPIDITLLRNAAGADGQSGVTETFRRICGEKCKRIRLLGDPWDELEIIPHFTEDSFRTQEKALRVLHGVCEQPVRDRASGEMTFI